MQQRTDRPVGADQAAAPVVCTARAAALACVLGAAATGAGAQTFHEIIGRPNTQSIAHDMKRLADGGYITVGEISSFPSLGPDFHVVRYDASGAVLWELRYGTTAAPDAAYSVAQTSDGGFIIAGNSDIFGDALNVALLRLDALGAVVWARLYEGDGSNEDVFGARGQQILELLGDGTFLVVGRKIEQGPQGSFQGGHALRVNGAGNPIFNRAYFAGAAGGPLPRNVSFAQSRRVDAASGVAIAGTIDNSPSTALFDPDLLGVRIDLAGNLLQSTALPSVSEAGERMAQRARGLELRRTQPVELLIAASAEPVDFSTRPLVEFVRLSTAILPLGARHYRDPFGNELDASSAAIHEDRSDGLHNALIGGTTFFGDGGQTAWMSLVDLVGDTIWSSYYGAQAGFTSAQTVAAPRTAADRREYHLAGLIQSATFGFGLTDIYFLRTDAFGQTGCFKDCVRPIVERPNVDRQAVTMTIRDFQGFENFPGQAIYGTPPVKVLCAGRLCPADINSDGIVDLVDFFDFLNAFDVNDPLADVNNDCVVDLNDFFVFLNLFDTSCL